MEKERDSIMLCLMLIYTEMHIKQYVIIHFMIIY